LTYCKKPSKSIWQLSGHILP